MGLTTVHLHYVYIVVRHVYIFYVHVVGNIKGGVTEMRGGHNIGQWSNGGGGSLFLIMI